MEVYEDFCVQYTVFGVTMEVEIPRSELRQEQQQQEVQEQQRTPLSLIKEIILSITLQTECYHVLVARSGTDEEIIKQHKSKKKQYKIDHHPIQIFTPGDKALQQYLSSVFVEYGDIIDIEQAANDIIEKWVEIRDGEEEFSSGVFGCTFSLELTFKLWVEEMLHETVSGPVRNEINEIEKMVRTSEVAIEKMLKVRKKKRKDLKDDEEELCGICLEKMERITIILEMPCSHMFHGWCILKWLRRSHLCPTCRFPMPKISS